jgi:hypothetical protein
MVGNEQFHGWHHVAETCTDNTVVSDDACMSIPHCEYVGGVLSDQTREIQLVPV